MMNCLSPVLSLIIKIVFGHKKSSTAVLGNKPGCKTAVTEHGERLKILDFKIRKFNGTILSVELNNDADQLDLSHS